MGAQIMGLVGILVSLVGLLLASRAADDGMYVDGMILAAFGVILVFWLIGRSGRARADG